MVVHSALLFCFITIACIANFATCDVLYLDVNHDKNDNADAANQQHLSNRRGSASSGQPEKTELVDGFGDENVPLEVQVFGTGAGRFQSTESRLEARRPLVPRLPVRPRLQHDVADVQQLHNEDSDNDAAPEEDRRNANDVKPKAENKDDRLELSSGGFAVDEQTNKLVTKLNTSKSASEHVPESHPNHSHRRRRKPLPSNSNNRQFEPNENLHRQLNSNTGNRHGPPPQSSGTLASLYSINFRHEFQRWNPRPIPPSNSHTDFVWYQSGNTTLDNGLFLNSGYEGVDVLTMPFRNYDLPTAAGDGQIEASLLYNGQQQFHANVTQVLTLRTRFNVQLFNIRLNTFPQPAEVHNVDDDLRLGHSGVTLTANGNEFWFGIVATNNGVWATYERKLQVKIEKNATWPAFAVVKRLADRVVLQSRYEQNFNSNAKPFITASIQYDGIHKLVNYYVNGRLLWKVSDFGVLPTNNNDDDGVLVYRSEADSSTLSNVGVDIENFGIVYVTRQALDWADPNTKTTDAQLLHGLVKIEQHTNGAYVNGTTFYDALALRSNIVRGQGAILTSQDLSVVERTLTNLQVRNLAPAPPNRKMQSKWLTDKKISIHNVDMPEHMQRQTADIATAALEKFSVERDQAAYIKKEFDRRFEPSWHVIVGRNFGSYVTHETGCFIYFYVNQTAVLIFKAN